MSHVIAIDDDLYNIIAAVAARHGEPVDQVAGALLARAISQEPITPLLDWELATAEEIITDLRANRVERDYDLDL